MCSCVRVEIGLVQNVVSLRKAIPRDNGLQRKWHDACLLQIVFKHRQVFAAEAGVALLGDAI